MQLPTMTKHYQKDDKTHVAHIFLGHEDKYNEKMKYEQSNSEGKKTCFEEKRIQNPKYKTQ